MKSKTITKTLFSLMALTALLSSCKKEVPVPPAENLPSVLFGGSLWAFDDQGNAIPFAENPASLSCHALVYQEDSPDGQYKKGDIQLRTGFLNSDLSTDFIRLGVGDSSFWAQKGQVAVNAAEAVTVMDATATLENGESIKIAAEQLLALFLDDLSSVYIPEYGQRLTLPASDFVSKEKVDIDCVALMAVARSQKNVEDKKDLFNQALSLEPCQALKDRINAELKSLEKPKSSFLRLTIPPMKNSGRYGVNMGEIMKGINDKGVTKDPFAQ